MVERLSLRVALVFPITVLAAAALLVVAQWPSYWVWIAPEQTPMTFVAAMVLFAASVFAGLLALVAWIEGRPRHEQLVWGLASFGFFFLMVDERFALHERLRDNVLAETGVGLPWGSPGDYLLVLFLLASLFLLPSLFRLLRAHRAALVFFAAGALLAAGVVAVDTIDVRSMSTRTERLEQTVEEIVEGVAAALLAAGLFLALSARLAALATMAPNAPRDGNEPASPAAPGARPAPQVRVSA